jgi:hypothetical protein
MTTHDRTHPSPYHLVFGAESMDDTLFPPIAAEAKARGNPIHDPDRFVFLSSVGHLLTAIAGPPDGDVAHAPPDEDVAHPPAAGGESADDRSAAGEAFRQHGRLLFHAFHFWREGRHEVALDEATVRRMLDEDVVGDERALAPPAPAGYLQLPRNLVWASPAPGLRPEPADGFFWMLDENDADRPVLHLLLALGVRPDRPGFSVVTASGVAESGRHWADTDARPGGDDFTTTLPGGELDRLYSLETTAELLKLASRCLLALGSDGG